MRSLLLVCSCVIPCAGVELVRRDFGLALEALPVAFDYTLSTPGGDISGSDEFERALGLRLGGRWSFSSPGATGAAMAGLDLRLGDAVYADNGSYRTAGVGLSLGYARNLGRRWTLYIEPLVEFGWATLDFDATTAAPAISADGTHLVYGARLGGLYALSPRWLIDAQFGWVDIVSDTDADRGSFELDQSGLMAGLGVVWRFSAAPARLE